MKVTYPDIDRLISLYLNNLASESERQKLEKWLEDSSDNRRVFKHLKQIWQMSAHYEVPSDLEQVRDQIWVAGTQRTHRSKAPAQQKVDIFYLNKVAATFLIFLFGAWLFSYLIRKDTPALSEPIALVEKLNPAGQRSNYRLPDGTAVWLNAKSSLTYPEKFADTLRLVQLRGEAFFEVAKDRQRPFIVEAGDIRTQALGTAFNIHAYAEEDMIKVALLEGKVRVQNINSVQTTILSPGEELLISNENSAISTQPFNYEITFGWKEGILIFEGADFISFINTLEKWYGVEVKVKGTPPTDWHIRAKYQNENLEHVLRDICFNKNIRFDLQDKNVLIIF